jgi:hypothetical protein
MIGVYKRPSRQLCAWLLMALFLVSGLGRAQTAANGEVLRIEPVITEGQLALDIDLSLTLNATMRQTLERGVPLYFTVQAQISKPRWWWFDQEVKQDTLVRRLSFNSITRQWRVSTGDVTIASGTFEQAMRGLERIRAWPIVFSDRFEPNTRYEGRVRVKLDTNQLARPLQMDPTKRNEWVLNSPWQAFDFSIRRIGRASP